MSDTSAVQLLTLNTKTVFQTSAAIERVKIHNNSSFFLRVYYGADAPANATDPGWHDTIDPGGTPLMEVVGNSAQVFANRSFVQSTPYLGIITVLPFLPAGALAGSGGVVTGGALCYLTAYYVGEWAQEGGEIESYVQAAKQGRYQEVLGGVAQPSSSSIPPLTQAATANTDCFQFDSLGPTRSPAIYAANAAGISVANFYLYWLHLRFRTRGPAAAACHPLWSLSVTDSNAAGGVVLGSIGLRLEPVFMATNWGYQDFIFAPSNPMVARIAFAQNILPGGGAFCWLRFIGFLSAAIDPISNTGFWDMSFNGMGMFDYTNQSIDYALPHAIPALEPPWNATYNPQTY